MRPDIDAAVREVATRLAEGFATPDEGLELGHKYVVSLEELWSAPGGPAEVLLQVVRRMTAALMIEMLRERWRVPGVPVFKFRTIPQDEARYGGVEVTVKMKTAAADLAAAEKAEKSRTVLTETCFALLTMASAIVDDPIGLSLLSGLSVQLASHGSREAIDKCGATVEAVIAKKAGLQ